MPLIVNDTEDLGGASSTISLAEPSGLAAAELMLAFLMNVDTTGTPETVPTPTGFTSDLGVVAGVGYFKTAHRVADGTESGPYTSVIPGDGIYRAGKMLRIFGAHPTAPIDAIGDNTGTGTTVTLDSLTATDGPCLAVAWVTVAGSTITTTPTGWTRYSLYDGSAEAIFYRWVPDGAASGAATCTLAGSVAWYTTTVLVRPDPARPALAGIVTENGTSLGSNNAQPLPANAAAGQLAVYCAINDNPSTTNLTGSTGWATATQQTQGSNVIKAQLFARLLDGTSGNNILSITGAAQDYSVIGVAVANHGLADQTEVASWLASAHVAGTTGSSATADPPNANPAVSDDYLALAFAGIDATSTGPANTITAVPSGMGQLGDSVLSASSTSSVTLRAAGQPVTASSLNPAAFANSNRGWIAYTLLIPPLDTTPATPAAPTLTAGVGLLDVDLPTLPDADSVDIRWKRTSSAYLPSITTQASAPWHLARIDGEGDSDYAQRFTGDGVYIYVIDSGVNADHDEFEDRAEAGASASGQNGEPTWSGDGPNPWIDQTPHGTGCASAAAGLINGVAKGAIIVPVKVGGAWTGGSSGLTEDIYNIPPATGTAHDGTEGLTIEAYEWAYEWILAHFQSLPAGTRAVITDSVTSRITGTTTPSTTGEHTTLATAVQACIDAGIPVVCLAQNFDQVVEHVPATMADTVCVGGVDETDARFVVTPGTNGSNFGTPVDIFAPARLDPTIGAPSHTSDTTYDTTVVGYGTSTATPIVAGAEALLLEENPHISPARLKNVQTSQAFADEIDLDGATSTVNLLVNSLATTSEWTVVTGIADGYDLDGLEPGIEYEVQIRQIIDGIPSDWSTADTGTPGGPPLSATIGQVVDVSTAMALGRRKARTVGQVVETSTAQPLGRTHRRTIAQTTETASAQPLGRRKTLSIGQVAETDTAGAMTPAGTLGGSIGQVFEVDLAHPLSRTKRKTIGQAVEADTAVSLGRVRARTLGMVVETDTAQAFGRVKRRQVGQVVETDSALPMIRVHTRTIGQVLEVDAALGLGRRKTATIGQALEVDTAGALTWAGAPPPVAIVSIGRAELHWRMTAASVEYHFGRGQVAWTMTEGAAIP